jgi:hypothetical protein
MIFKNHELCRKILSHLYHLRNDLKKLEEENPAFFIEEDLTIGTTARIKYFYSPIIVEPYWHEFFPCTTDEILETLSLHIEKALKTSEQLELDKMNEK